MLTQDEKKVSIHGSCGLPVNLGEIPVSGITVQGNTLPLEVEVDKAHARRALGSG
jgi:hypothetical protein